MLIRLVVTLSIGAAIILPSLAQTSDAPPASADECLKIAFELQQAAEEKKLSDEQFNKFNDMMTVMEGHCEGSAFKDAAASASNIKTMLGALQ